MIDKMKQVHYSETEQLVSYTQLRSIFQYVSKLPHFIVRLQVLEQAIRDRYSTLKIQRSIHLCGNKLVVKLAISGYMTYEMTSFLRSKETLLDAWLRSYNASIGLFETPNDGTLFYIHVPDVRRL